MLSYAMFPFIFYVITNFTWKVIYCYFQSLLRGKQIYIEKTLLGYHA